MNKIISYLYGLMGYALGMVALVGLIFFTNSHMGVFGIDALLPLNANQQMVDLAINPILLNVLLVALFAVQHSIMARPAFKTKLTKVIPSHLERSTYMIGTALVTFVLIYYWQPIEGNIWVVQDETYRNVLNTAFYFGWIFTTLATFMINHFHLFGLQQSFNGDNPDAGSKVFRTPMFYKIVRHPIQTGVAIARVSTPDMTYDRAILAAGMLVYIAIGLRYEEADLMDEFGETYGDYKKRVSSVIPFLKRG